MKKYLLFISCSIIAAQAASALTADQQLSNMKEMFVKEFQNMDTDKNGEISRDEYMAYQFETFRTNIINADGFDKPAKATEETPQVNVDIEETPVSTDIEEPVAEDVELGGASSLIRDMAEFKLEDLEDEADKKISTLTKEDVMPDDLSLITDDLLATESARLEAQIDKAEEVASDIIDNAEDIVITKAEDTVEEVMDEETKMNEMIKTIQATLPKKIDEITSWTDIQYADKVITYIYKADIDVSEYSPGDYNDLVENIQKEACVKANTEMCPKVKPMFIDHGINMKIRYLDKKDAQIGECEFNQQTCQ